MILELMIVSIESAMSPTLAKVYSQLCCRGN